MDLNFISGASITQGVRILKIDVRGRRTVPLSVHLGIGAEEHDQEGRVLTAEYENLFVVNAYVPNAGEAPAPCPNAR